MGLLASQVPVSVSSIRSPVLCGPLVLAFCLLYWWPCEDQKEGQDSLSAPTLMGGGFPFQVSMGKVRGRRASLGHNPCLGTGEAEQGQRLRYCI